MDEEDGRLGPRPGHIIGNGTCFAKYGTRQQDGFQDPDRLQWLMDVTGGMARQPGRCDVLTDASMKSLRRPKYFKRTGCRVPQVPVLGPGRNPRTPKDQITRPNHKRGKP